MTHLTDPYGYDELPYPSAPYPYTHPDHLATLARLFGLQPCDVHHCRVLEVGCADGANLIPLALTLPASHFVGIDLSRRQIENGQRLIRQLGLTNITLGHADLDQWQSSEQFDYILAHGFYSWTPLATRDTLLAFCRRQLASQGIAFISYNVFPGWQVRYALRQWLLGPAQKQRAAIEMSEVRNQLVRLRDLISGAEITTPLQEIRQEVEQLLSWSDAYLRHDLLEDFNQPVTFGEFTTHLAGHGLRFLAEADFASMLAADLPDELAADLPRVAKSAERRESLLDLLTQRTFRQSLVCHAEMSPQGQIGPERLFELYAASPLREMAIESSAGERSVLFQSRQGWRLPVDDADCVAALRELRRCWPASRSLSDLVDGALHDAGVSPETHDLNRHELLQRLATLLLTAFAKRAVELHTIPAAFDREVADWPVASPLARIQAVAQTWVTNLRHDVVTLNTEQRELLVRLDGTVSQEKLAAADLQQFARWGLLCPRSDR